MSQDRIFFVAAEAAPFVKVGGLGDVAGSLPVAISSLQDQPDIRLVLPLHPQVRSQYYSLEYTFTVEVRSRKGMVPAEVFEANYAGLKVYFIKSPYIQPEDPVYALDASLDGLKYAHFSLAALELARVLEWRPDILHAHDWHAAAAVYALFRTRDKDPFFSNTRSLLTVHNLPYHGQGAQSAWREFNLPRLGNAGLPQWAANLPLPIALATADHINTVSPGYAAEMLTEEFGAGLADFLQSHRSGDLTGILNGLDQEIWNPDTDTFIESRFSRDLLGGKSKNKAGLQREMDLPVDPTVPLVAVVSRLDPQKGVDLAIEALEKLEGEAWQFVLLGNGQPSIEEAAVQLALDFPDRVAVRIGFDAGLGHRIYAGSDMFLIPSRYEPCGLSQMIAMRYGSVPVAAAVGGLRDTIDPYRPDGSGTGFLFSPTTAGELKDALSEAFAAFWDKRRWKGLQRRGMKLDFSWSRSAAEYQKLYRHIMEKSSSKIGRS